MGYCFHWELNWAEISLWWVRERNIFGVLLFNFSSYSHDIWVGIFWAWLSKLSLHMNASFAQNELLGIFFLYRLTECIWGGGGCEGAKRFQTKCQKRKKDVLMPSCEWVFAANRDCDTNEWARASSNWHDVRLYFCTDHGLRDCTASIYVDDLCGRCCKTRL